MSEENKAISRRLLEEAFNQGNLDVVDELVDASYEFHDPAVPPDIPKGPEGVKMLIAGYRTAFPDLRLTIEELIAEGNTVVSRWTGTGTHQGDFFGIAPTGKESTTTGITIDRIENGKLVESYTNWDTLGVLQQLGAIPALTEA